MMENLYPTMKQIKEQIAEQIKHRTELLFDEVICPMCYRLNPQHETMDNGEGCHWCQEKQDWLDDIGYTRQPVPEDKEMINPPASWRVLSPNVWQYHAPGYAVYGSITQKTKTKLSQPFWWEARVMDDCRPRLHPPIAGKSPTLEEAKLIVEVLCRYTRTAKPLLSPVPELTLISDLLKDNSFEQIDIPDCVFQSEEAKAVGFTKRSFLEAGWRKLSHDIDTLKGKR